MNQVIAAPAVPLSRLGQNVPSGYTILIEVPELSDRSHASGWTASVSRNRVQIDSRSSGQLHPRRRARRRLKREVKVAICLLLSCLPPAYHASRVWSSRLGNIAVTDLTRTADPVDGREGSDLGSALARKVSRSIFEPAVVLMSIEPAQSGSKFEMETPVILPGYLLPAEPLEEPVHEGS